ncbi:MAG: glycosyltransferase [Elusimicrobiota bacterium]
MKLSIVIPAYNEAKLLPACLASVRKTLADCGRSGTDTEVIVCDNNSTDDTARIAHAAGARVVFEPVNMISRSRNAGASAASGDWLLFIDADSQLSAGSLRNMLTAAASGRWVGGGCIIDLDRKPWWGILLVGLWNLLARAFRLAAGSFVFCRTDAFRAVGGFPPELAAAEELGLSYALKLWGKPRGLGFTVLTRNPHVSSGRKFDLYTTREFLTVLFKIARSPRHSLRDPGVNIYLYDGRR